MTVGRRHLSDEELVEEIGDSPTPRIADHLAGCAFCRRRRADAEAVRALVARVADAETAPPVDIARAALARISSRRRVSADVNEIIAGFSSFARSLMLLFFRRRP